MPGFTRYGQFNLVRGRVITTSLMILTAMTFLLQDFRYAVRVLIKSPGFTLAVALTMALGIGANSAIFSVVNAVLLRALPYQEPHQLMVLKNAMLSFSGTPSASNLLDWKEQAQSFSHLAAYSSSNGGVNLTDGGEPERIEGKEVTADFFATMAVNAVNGRTFQPDEDQPGKNTVIVIGYSLWQRRFEADRNIIGRNLLLNGRGYTVIGVAPPGFEFPGKAEVWVPISFGKDRAFSGQPIYEVIGRLGPEVSREQAQAEINVFVQKLKEQDPGLWVVKRGIQVISLLDQLVSGFRLSLLILFGVVSFVLLIACSNVINLLLVRAVGRQKEIAIRMALGAGRGALIRQLIVESLLLSFLGGALGLLAGSWFMRILISLSPSTIPRLGEAALDARVLAFTFFISLLTGCLVGLAPALQSLKVDLNESLKEAALKPNGRSSSGSIRNKLIISEIALAMVLLMGAGLLVKSLNQIHKVDPGFNADGVLTVNVSLPDAKYGGSEQKEAFFRELIERLRSIPSTLYVGAVNFLPLGKADAMKGAFTIEGHPPANRFEDQLATYLVITPDYLRAMGIPLIQGRYLAEQDAKDSQPVVLINQLFAKSHWPNESPVGKHLSLPGDSVPREIIGIVGAVKHIGLDAETPKEIYMPYGQTPLSLRTVVIRTTSDPLSIAGGVRDEVRALDKDLPVYDIKTVNQRLIDSMSHRRFVLLIFTIFAGVALILAAVGVYSVMSYTVAQRAREIGIRMALGAQRRDVLKLMVGKAIKPILIGVAIGMAGAIAIMRLMSDMLFGVTTTDPMTLALVALGVTGVALLASQLPVMRSTRLDPIAALRNE